MKPRLVWTARRSCLYLHQEGYGIEHWWALVERRWVRCKRGWLRRRPVAAKWFVYVWDGETYGLIGHTAKLRTLKQAKNFALFAVRVSE